MTEHAPHPLDELARRVEEASGPDRELDAEVMFDLFARPVGQREDGGPAGYLWPEDSPSWSFGIRFPGKDLAWLTEARKRNEGETLGIERDGALVLMNDLRIPPLTSSLDAVISLLERVLPGCAFVVHGPDEGRYFGGVGPCLGEAWGDDSDVSASSPARALLAAVLRALSRTGEGL